MQQQQNSTQQPGSPLRGDDLDPEHQTYQNEGGDDQYDYEGQGSPEVDENGVTKKLVGSRVARKRAEEDVKLLANRIALLKMEEKKAWKKIEDTKKKAKEIMSVKQRNLEQQRIKDQRRKDKELEEKMLAERNYNMKSQIKEGIQQTKEQLQKKLLDEAERLKLEKREQKELLNMQKQQEQLKNASIKQMIKNQELENEERKRKEAAEKKARTRAELQQKIIQENQRRLAIEAEVSRLEQEELELIQRLQNTQVLQKAAYEDLETALNNQNSPGNPMMQSQISQNKSDVSPVKSFTSSDQKGGRPMTSGNNKFTPQNGRQ